MSLLTRTAPRPAVHEPRRTTDGLRSEPAARPEPSDRPHRADRRRRADTGPLPEPPAHRELVRRDLAAEAQRIRLGDLVREHGSPLFVLDTARIAAQLAELRRELPGVGIHFATKSLPHPAVIRAVQASGASFEVASRGEVDLLEREGVAIAGCLHTHPVKTAADLTGAYLRGIRTFVVDSPSEIGKFAGLPSGEVGVLVRLSFPNPGAKSDLSSKFGVAPEHAAALVERCLAARLPVRGFTFHVGSQTTSAEPWRRAIATTLQLMRVLEARHGIRFDLLDLGGGFPVAYDEPVPPLGDLARGIRSALAAVPRHVRVVVEPGRFVAAPAMTLVTRVVGTSERADGRWHYLDEGLYGAYSNIPAEDVHALVFAASELGVRPSGEDSAERAARRVLARTRVPVTLAGPTCDSVDVIARRLPLPPLADGDLLVSPMMGAYTWATATGFNGIAPTPVLVLPAS
ncbi:MULTISPECIES: type III PLP-dependent enzyme [unclassified Agromyces]|uniref:type III PLP-dependent enzyme n=1 Tax=unclassified Agromyces TaxID=2639701 RepID=UPI003014415D